MAVKTKISLKGGRIGRVEENVDFNFEKNKKDGVEMTASTGNSVLDGIIKDSSKTLTENGDVAYTTTQNNNLDFFFGASLFRGNDEKAVQAFIKAYTQNKNLAVKNLFYLRDIKGGQGLRSPFRACLAWLAKENPELVINLLPKFVEYGRWDDILFLGLKTEGFDENLILEVESFVNEQFIKDSLTLLENKNAKEKGETKVKPISLLAKWMPKINSKSPKVRQLAYRWANVLAGGNKKLYRKALRDLREHLKLVETALVNKDYDSITYEHVPARAMKKYSKAFERNDKERYSSYIESLQSGKNEAGLEKLKQRSKNLFPYEILIQSKNGQREMSELLWTAMQEQNPNLGQNSIVVYDSSGSMGVTVPQTNNVRVIDVAQSLAIALAEKATGPFKDKVITFSRTPRFIDLDGATSLHDKIQRLRGFSIAENTDISKLYDLIFEASLAATNPEDYLKQVIIVTDCQFDAVASYQGVTYDKSTYDVVKQKFVDAGIPMPQMVYWNLNARTFTIPSVDIENVALISGFSTNIVTSLTKGLSGEDIMLDALNKYSFVDEVI